MICTGQPSWNVIGACRGEASVASCIVYCHILSRRTYGTSVGAVVKTCVGRLVIDAYEPSWHVVGVCRVAAWFPIVYLCGVICELYFCQLHFVRCFANGN